MRVLPPKGEAVNVALELAEAVAVNAPLAVAAFEEAHLDGYRQTRGRVLASSELAYGCVQVQTTQKKASRAFAEKRAPRMDRHLI